MCDISWRLSGDWVVGEGVLVLAGASGKYLEKRPEILGDSIAFMWSSKIFIFSSFSLLSVSMDVIFVFAIIISFSRYSRWTDSGVIGGPFLDFLVACFFAGGMGWVWDNSG